MAEEKYCTCIESRKRNRWVIGWHVATNSTIGISTASVDVFFVLRSFSIVFGW